MKQVRAEEVLHLHQSTIDGDYNTAPSHWMEINEAHFTRLFFLYIKKHPVHRQIIRDISGEDLSYTGSSCLFELAYKGCEGLGVAIAQSKDRDQLRFFKFGDMQRWHKFEQGFAAQFAGDNS
jgi:hypothetical protein